MENMIFDIWVSRRMEFSDEEKRGCIETVREIVTLAMEARKHGILCLEIKIPNLHSVFLQKAIQLAVDGNVSETIRRIMQNYIIAGNYRGKELLNRILMMEGTIAIVNGMNPRHISEMELASYFGEDFLPEYEKSLEFPQSPASAQSDRDNFFEAIKGRQCSESAKPLDEILKMTDNFALQRILTSIDCSDCALAMKDLSEFAIIRLLNNMSERSKDKLISDYLCTRNIRVRDIETAQSEILHRIKELEESGEIICVGNEAAK